MTQPEQLLSALAERERQLRQERIASSHATTLLAAMDVLHGSDSPEDGLRQVLEITREAVGADTAAILSLNEDDGARLQCAVPSQSALHLSTIPAAALTRPRRIADLGESVLSSALTEAAAYGSALSMPVVVHDESPLAILLFAQGAAHFSRHDLDLLRRIASMLEQAIDRMRFAHRNAILASVVEDSGSVEVPALFRDSSFDVLSRAYDRVVDWQGRILDITNELLGDRSGSVDRAIDQALARTGELAGSDRTYVFRLRPPDRIDNTHEWVAPGITPMIEHLQDMPADLLDEWRPALEAGRPEYISDIDALPKGSEIREVLQMQGIRSLLAVPMMQNGTLTGFVGFDAVRSHRTFLPAEIQLLQSVANAVGVVLDRASAEVQAADAIARLLQERDRTEATLAAIPYLVLEFDKEGRFEKYRTGGNGVPIVPPEEAIGRMPEEFLPPYLARISKQMMEEADRKSHSQPHEYTLEWDGEARWFEASAAAKGNRPEAGSGYVFVVRDITERRHRQQDLRRLGRIAELTSNYVIVADPGGRIEWVNPAFERRTGWTLEEVRGRRPGDVLWGERTDAHAQARIRSALHEGRADRVEILHCSRSGEEYWVSVDIQPLHDETGQLEGFVFVHTDITAMHESHQRALRLRAAALEASSDGIGITDATGHYFYLNPAHRRMFGIAAHEDVGKLRWHDFYDVEERRRITERVMPKLKAEGAWQGRTRGLRRDGTMVEQDVALSPTDDGGLLCITRDVTRQRELEAERNRLRDELQVAQRRETVAQLASGVAHDLNNLVAVVSGTVALLESECGGTETVQTGLDRITRSMDAARDLVAGLGDVSRPASPRAIVDLRQVVDEAVDLLGSERIERHAIETVLPEAQQPVWANRTALLQVALNLALNACESGEDPKVTLAVGPDLADQVGGRPDVGTVMPGEDYAFFSVSDTGEGVDPLIQPRLFERYMTTKGDSGTGLGLPIIAGILKENGGVLWFDSVPGRGSTVTVAWPATRPGIETPRADARDASEQGDLAGQRVLVVDDMPDVAAVLSGMLEAAGANPTAVSDPEDAMRLLESGPSDFAVLVTDLDMPGIGGIEVARIAAQQDPPVPCVLVTAKGDQVGRHQHLFHRVLAKPVEAISFARAVQQAAQSRGYT